MGPWPTAGVVRPMGSSSLLLCNGGVLYSFQIYIPLQMGGSTPIGTRGIGIVVKEAGQSDPGTHVARRMCYVLFFYRSKEQTCYYLLVLLCIEHYQKEKEKTEACRDQIASSSLITTVLLQIKMILYGNVLGWQLL